jgi:mersacidin/lichenicidin family type 2 lantibiotic
MSKIDVVRAWKDEGYRAGLSADQRETLPDNPAGVVDLSDVQQSEVNGGFILTYAVTFVFNCISFDVTCNKNYCKYLDSLKTQSAYC